MRIVTVAAIRHQVTSNRIKIAFTLVKWASGYCICSLFLFGSRSAHAVLDRLFIQEYLGKILCVNILAKYLGQMRGKQNEVVMTWQMLLG